MTKCSVACVAAVAWFVTSATGAGQETRSPHESVVSDRSVVAPPAAAEPLDIAPFVGTGKQALPLPGSSPGGLPSFHVQDRVGEEDERRPVSTAGAYPARAVVRIVSDLESCSGWLVDDDLVVTAGHCVFSQDRRRWAGEVRVLPAQAGKNLVPFGSCGAVRMYTTRGWRERMGHTGWEYDYGAIQLDCHVGQRTGWFGVSAAPGLLPGAAVMLLGYPGQLVGNYAGETLEGYTMFDAPGSLYLPPPGTVVPEEYLLYTSDSSSGMSGGPVSLASRRDHAIAIHTYGCKAEFGDEGSCNRGIRLTADVLRNIRAWRDAT